MGTLVCFHAQPDDESISTGGSIARAVAEGHRVVVVVATNGDHGEVPDDPAFTGLPPEFTVMESHCGQIEWPPAGWTLVATAGQGSQTRMQCLRVNGRPIYAAQFHIEMTGTPEASRKIMSNFLGLAKKWSSARTHGAR